MRIHGEIVLTEHAEVINILYSSLLPEVRTPPSYRSRSEIRVSPQKMVLTIEAADLVSFRAAVNSYLRLINALIRVLREID